mgnify:CR=1 FL=1
MTEYNAERIVQARHLEGMTQRELSERSHISQSKLSKLQNGFIVFKENEARAIAAALGSLKGAQAWRREHKRSSACLTI